MKFCWHTYYNQCLLRLQMGFFLKVNDLVGKQEACTEPVPWKSLLLAHDKSSCGCFSRKDLLGETRHEWGSYTAFERYHCKKISSHVQCKLWIQFLSFALISSFCYSFFFLKKRGRKIFSPIQITHKHKKVTIFCTRSKENSQTTIFSAW